VAEETFGLDLATDQGGCFAIRAGRGLGKEKRAPKGPQYQQAFISKSSNRSLKYLGNTSDNACVPPP
jgi:hypothetical protein